MTWHDVLIKTGHGREAEGATRQPGALLHEEIELTFAHGIPLIERI